MLLSLSFLDLVLLVVDFFKGGLGVEFVKNGNDFVNKWCVIWRVVLGVLVFEIVEELVGALF